MMMTMQINNFGGKKKRIKIKYWWVEMNSGENGNTEWMKYRGNWKWQRGGGKKRKQYTKIVRCMAIEEQEGKKTQLEW